MAFKLLFIMIECIKTAISIYKSFAVFSGKEHRGEQARFNCIIDHLFISSECYCYSNQRSFVNMSTVKNYSFLRNSQMDCLVRSNRLFDNLNIARRVSLLGQHSERIRSHSPNIFLNNDSPMNFLKKISSKRLGCFFSSDIIDNGQIRPRKLGYHNISDNVHKPSGHHLKIKTHANFQPKDIDTDDSLTSSVEGENPKISNWWKNIPKRWSIVLLCFTAFLLCNMDRVRYYLWLRKMFFDCVIMDHIMPKRFDMHLLFFLFILLIYHLH